MNEGFKTIGDNPNVTNVLSVKLTDKEILERAIQKAIDNGWVKPKHLDFEGIDEFIIYNTDSHSDEPWFEFKTRDLVFDKSFCKALWGDKFINPEMRDDIGSKIIAFQQTAWKHHLRQMVISDDPIKYLGENI